MKPERRTIPKEDIPYIIAALYHITPAEAEKLCESGQADLTSIEVLNYEDRGDIRIYIVRWRGELYEVEVPHSIKESD